MLNPFATATSATAPNSTPAREPLANQGGEPVAGEQPEPGGGLLDGGRERERDPHRPQQAEPEGRTDLGVGPDPRRVVVGCTRLQSRTEPAELPEPPGLLR